MLRFYKEPFGYLIKPLKERELHVNIEIALYKHEMEKKLKESEKRLQEMNQWLGAVIKTIGDAVIATDPQGTIKLMNPIAEALTGWDQKESIGKNLNTVFNIASEENDTKIEDPVRKTIREGMFYGLAENTILITKQNMKIPVDIIGSTIKMDRNRVIGIVLIFYDIIERKKIYETMKSH